MTSENDLNSRDANKREENASSVDEELGADQYYYDVVSNETSARILLSMFLDPRILAEIDLSTLRIAPTRDVEPNGAETIGDVFFVVDMKDRPGRKGRRAVFVSVSEHKLTDDPQVAIQLLGYIVAVLKRMNKDRDRYVDENGRLPAPYPILFSQDARAKKKPLRLREIVWNVDGLEDFVPSFEFQTIYAADVPLETIKKCEPVMRTFLHLTQIANKKHTPEEDVELAETFRLLLESPDSDVRARQCAIASLHYFIRLQQRRPGMMTIQELKQEIAKQKGEPMDKYDGLRLFFEEEFSETYEKGREDGVQIGIQTGVQTGIYNTIFRNLQTKYGANSVSKRLNDKIDAINYYPALEDVQTAVWTTPSLDAFERKVDKIAKQYEAEIQERRR